MIAAGLALAFLRPYIKPARLLAPGIFCIGASFLLYEHRGRALTDPAVSPIQGLTWFLLFLGVAFLLHTSYYFPRERRNLLRSGPWRYLPYFLALVAWGFALGFGSVAVPPALLGLILVHIATRLKFRGHASSSARGGSEKYIIAGVLLICITLAFRLVIGNRLSENWDLMLRTVPAIVLLGAYLQTISRFRLLGLRIGRGIQYSIATAFFVFLICWVFFSVLVSLSGIEIPAFNINLTTRDIEFHNRAPDPHRRMENERFILMIAAIVLAFGFGSLLRKGHQFLKKKFYRTSYDDNTATQELTELLTSKHGMDDLARGIVTKLAGLMLLKRVGIIFFRDEKTVCCAEGHGFRTNSWKELCLAAGPEIARTMNQFRAELCVDYLQSQIRGPLEDSGLKYIYPIHSRDKLVGSLFVGEKLSETTYRQEDFYFLSARANQVAAAIENAFLYEKLAAQERLHRELELARHIQISSLPQAEPEVSGLDISGASIPALEVGGDYYAYFQGCGRELTLIVGDISGKGTSAALYMSKMQGIFSSLQENCKNPRDLFVRANPILYREMEKKAFATAIGAKFDTVKKEIVLARAGHVPLLCFRAQSNCAERHIPVGLALGIENKGIFTRLLEEQHLTYREEDVFLFLSDGLTEALDREGAIFGEKGVMRLLQGYAHLSAQEIRDNILEEIQVYTTGTEQHDDQTLVVVKAKG